MAMNPKLQTAFWIISACGSLAGVVNAAYITCDRLDCWKHLPAAQIRINPCPPILPPGKDCNSLYPQKAPNGDVN